MYYLMMFELMLWKLLEAMLFSRWVATLSLYLFTSFICVTSQPTIVVGLSAEFPIVYRDFQLKLGGIDVVGANSVFIPQSDEFGGEVSGRTPVSPRSRRAARDESATW